MPFDTAPQTKAIGLAIVSYLQALTYPDITPVYTQASLESIKDVIDLTANGGVCVEVYGNTDTSERRGFGGRIWDTAEWYILSLCSLDTPDLAAKIYDARDALVQPFQKHAQLGNIVSNLFHSQLKDGMRFMRVERNGQFMRGHLAEIVTKQEWVLQGGVIS